MIDGKYVPNIHCRRCTYRHPANLTCEEAKMHAEKERLRRQVCTGCGGPLDSNYDCPRCDERAAMLIATSHWPLETSLSPRALECIEEAVGRYVGDFELSGWFAENTSVEIELHNLCSNIRSHLQHVEDELRARKRKAAEPKDPLLL